MIHWIQQLLFGRHSVCGVCVNLKAMGLFTNRARTLGTYVLFVNCAHLRGGYVRTFWQLRVRASMHQN